MDQYFSLQTLWIDIILIFNYNNFFNNKKKFQDSRCLFSNHILTNRSLIPVVAKRVPSGLKLIKWTGIAVRHFHTQFQAPGSLAKFVSKGCGLSASPPIENVTASAMWTNKFIIY